MPDAASEESLHTRVATRLLHGRSAVVMPAVSPDGAHVAVVVSTIDLDKNTTSTRIWLDGTPLTAGPYDGEPAWSPDGRFLAFTSRRGEKKGDSTLHVMPVEGPGEVRTLCTRPDGLESVAWSPDGRWIAFTSRTRDERYEADDASWQTPRRIERFQSRLDGENWIFDRPQHVYAVAADGTAPPRNLTPGEFHHDDISWLADSSGIVTSAPRHETWDTDWAVDLHVVPLDGGEIRPLTAGTGNFRAPAVSPDGTQVAFAGFDDPMLWPQNTRIGLIPVDGGEHAWISEGLDRPFASGTCPTAPVWLDDRTLLAAVEDRGSCHLYRLHVDGQPPEPLTMGALSVHGFDAAAGVVATARSTVRHPADLWVDRSGADERLTHVASDHQDWERFEVPCADGSDEIDAWLMRPVEFDPAERYPVLLNVHGGPFTQYGEYFFDEAQMQAAAGFVVVMGNPRGSSGRHTGWGQAINGRRHPTVRGSGWGSVDVDDVMSVLDAALARYPFCHPDRVGMLGGSYGGYMATTLAALFGGHFRAICSERSVNNLVTFEGTSDITGAFRATHGLTVVDDPDEYMLMSPSRLAHDIHVPMLIIHSDEDYRAPISQAEELWATLRTLGRDVTFYRFPGEGHELSRSGSPVHRRMRAEIILDFFAEHLATPS